MTTKQPYAPSLSARIADLDPFFGPDAPTLPDADPMPDAMQQNPCILHAMQILQETAGRTSFTNSDDPFRPHRRQVTYSPMSAWRLATCRGNLRRGYVILKLPISCWRSHLDTAARSHQKARLRVPGGDRDWRVDASGGDIVEPRVGDLQDGAWTRFPSTPNPMGLCWDQARVNLNLRWNEGAVEAVPGHRGVLLVQRGLRLAMESALQERDARIRELEARLVDPGGPTQ